MEKRVVVVERETSRGEVESPGAAATDREPVSAPGEPTGGVPVVQGRATDQVIQQLRRVRRRALPYRSRRERAWLRASQPLRRLRRAARARLAGDARPATDLRILVASPPKTGNTWLKHLLASVYGLRILDDPLLPTAKERDGFKRFAEGGHFPPGSVFHAHFHYSEELCRIAAAVPCRIVTIVRDPYDMFVSLYHHVQRAPEAHPPGSRNAVLIGKPIDHPDVVRYLADHFGRPLENAVRWVESGCSIVVRYEDLLADPVGTLTRVTDQIQPVAPEAIARAVEQNTADKMRQKDRGLAAHVRVATSGDWKNHLTRVHLDAVAHHAEQIRRLGYDVA